MAICKICGQPVTIGVVVHTECLPRWIPASEPPLDEDEEVFVIVSGHFCDIYFEDALEFAYYNNVDGWILEHYPDWDCPGVRYWMPTDFLPNPPKEML